MTPEPLPVAVDPADIQARAVRLATGLAAPLGTMGKRMIIGFLGSAVIGFVVGTATYQPFLGTAVGLALAALVAVVAWAPFTDAGFRGAAELYFDHGCHERAEWKTETGTSMPSGIRAIERWLDAHPEGPGRASLLLVVGRIDEADRVIAAKIPTTPVETFEMELLRQTRSLLLGQRPELDRLHAIWPSIPDPRERRHRRECLALLEGELAVAEGGDPIAVLAAARIDVREVYWSMRVPWLMAKWSSLAAWGLMISTFVSAMLVWR